MIQTRARSIAAPLALALVAVAGCSTGHDTDAADEPATFRQVRDDALQYEEPFAQVTDLQPPVAPNDPWRVSGSILDPESGLTQAAVWSATTPPEWEVQRLDPADDDVSESISAMAPRGEELLAVGRVGDGASADAALWRGDGETWRQSTPAVMGGEHEQWAFDVAVGPNGVLVAGGETVWGEVRPRLWFSPDGETWETVDGGPGGPLDTTGEESVQAIAAYGDGFVAVGMRDPDGQQDGAAWFSPDGVNWEPVTTMALPGRQNMLSVAVVNNVVVAGGYIDDQYGQGQPFVWTSLDGRTWGDGVLLELHDDLRYAGGDQGVRSLAVNGTQLIAAGGADTRPHLWTSDDMSVTWNRQTNPVNDAAFPDGIDVLDASTAADGRFLALGSEPTVMELSRGRWADRSGDAFPRGGNLPAATTALLDDGTLMTAGYSLVAAHEDQRKRYTGRVWRRDGGDFEVAEPTDDLPDLEAGKVNDMARISSGYVAVGFEDFGYGAQRTTAPTNGDQDPDGLVWTSEDGQGWTRQAAELQNPDPQALSTQAGDITAAADAATRMAFEQPRITVAPAGGYGTRTLEAVAPLGDGYVAVGWALANHDNNTDTPLDIDAIVAVSADGVGIGPEDAVLAGPGTQRLSDVCVSDLGVLAVGHGDLSGDFDLALRLRTPEPRWVEPPGRDPSMSGPGNQRALGCAASDEGFVVVGTDDSHGNVDGRVWTSPDGNTWTEVQSGALGGAGQQHALAAAAVPDGGWLVAGTDTRSGDSDVALWRVSANGQIVRRDRGEPSLAGPGDQTVKAVVVDGNRAVVVGQDQTGVGIWETSRLDR